VKFKLRLINKEESRLIIGKFPELELNQKDLIKFLELKQDINVDRILQKFNEKDHQLKLGTKLKGYLKLKYQTNYKIELIKSSSPWKNSNKQLN